METRDIYWDRWGGRILSWMEIFANRRGVIAASASASLIQSKYCPLPPRATIKYQMTYSCYATIRYAVILGSKVMT